MSELSLGSACVRRSGLSDVGTDLNSTDVPDPPQHMKSLARQLAKTRFCKHFVRGFCRYQDNCAYAHDYSELVKRPNLVKTKICVSYLSGMCHNSDCTYAHDRSELRRTSGDRDSSESGMQSMSDLSQGPASSLGRSSFASFGPSSYQGSSRAAAQLPTARTRSDLSDSLSERPSRLGLLQKQQSPLGPDHGLFASQHAPLGLDNSSLFPPSQMPMQHSVPQHPKQSQVRQQALLQQMMQVVSQQQLQQQPQQSSMSQRLSTLQAQLQQAEAGHPGRGLHPAKVEADASLLRGNLNQNHLDAQAQYHALAAQQLQMQQAAEQAAYQAAQLQQLGPQQLPPQTLLSQSKSAPQAGLQRARAPAQADEGKLFHELLGEIAMLIKEDSGQPQESAAPDQMSAAVARWASLAQKRLAAQRGEVMTAGRFLLQGYRREDLSLTDQQTMAYLMLSDLGWESVFPGLAQRCSRKMEMNLRAQLGSGGADLLSGRGGAQSGSGDDPALRVVAWPGAA